MVTHRTRATWLGVSALVGLGLGLVACTAPETTPTRSTTIGSPEPPPSQSSSPAPSASADPAVAEAEQFILEAYRGYWAAKVASYADPSQPQDPNLAVYAVDRALADAQSTIFQLQSDGVRLVGEPTLAPEVTNIVVGPEGHADIRDCVDSANWTPVLVSTGDLAGAPDQFTRLQAFATAYFYDDRWTIQTFTPDRESPC